MSKLRKIKIVKSHLPTPRSFIAYAGVFTVFVSAIASSYQSPTDSNSISSLLTTTVSAAQQDSSVDEATALLVAGDMALHADLPIAANIASRSSSLYINSIMSEGSAGIAVKPLISTSVNDARTIQTHVVKQGDTPQTIADEYHVSVQTIKWANNLNTDTLEADSMVLVPPVDGVLYTVKDGDSIESIAAKYKSDAEQITAFNDLELSGVVTEQRIVLPGGELPVEERPDYVAPVQTSIAVTAAPSSMTGSTLQHTAGSQLVNGFSPIAMTAAGNAYAFGNCTSWAYERRVQLGYPVGSYWGNAATWDSSARAAGYVVDKNPTVGAVFQMPAFVDAYTGVYGHVGIVESVSPNGSIYISEMNYAGNLNVVTYRTIPAAQVALYNYIH